MYTCTSCVCCVPVTIIDWIFVKGSKIPEVTTLYKKIHELWSLNSLCPQAVHVTCDELRSIGILIEIHSVRQKGNPATGDKTEAQWFAALVHVFLSPQSPCVIRLFCHRFELLRREPFLEFFHTTLFNENPLNKASPKYCTCKLINACWYRTVFFLLYKMSRKCKSVKIKYRRVSLQYDYVSCMLQHKKAFFSRRHFFSWKSVRSILYVWKTSEQARARSACNLYVLIYVLILNSFLLVKYAENAKMSNIGEFHYQSWRAT